MDQYHDLVQSLLDYGRELGVYLIIRLQEVKSQYIVINGKKTEEMAYNESRGIGLQAFTPRGGSGFATTEKLTLETCKGMVRLAADMAFAMEQGNGELNTNIFHQKPVQEQVMVTPKFPLNSLSFQEIEALLLQVNEEVLNQYRDLSVETFYRGELEEWWILRSDGTDVRFNIPRTVVNSTITAKGEKTATTRGAMSGEDLSILLDPSKRQRLMKRIFHACQLAKGLLHAPKLPPGKRKIVLDYAMAKGLAHEAFGHGAESDGMKTSILADSLGNFAQGKQVAGPHVSIIDESIPGDYAYQPFSANGIPREPVAIIKEGKLNQALTDVFSAQNAGGIASGAARAESYRHIPLPRMSNIRIEVNNVLPMEGDFEDITPETLYATLVKAGAVAPGEEVLYLMGYRGGQVKPSQGEFVFNCSGIVLLGPQCTLYQPEIFSGKVLSALQSVEMGLGPLLLDAHGICGKSGQGVPSSGGSHYFILLRENDEVIIGGA